MRRCVAILLLVSTAWLMSPATANSTSECLLGLRPSLIKGGFSGPLVCSKSNATFSLVGRTNKSRYSIYDYRYKLLTRKGGVMHGGQRIVVFQGRRYIGQYSLSPPPYNLTSVSGDHIVVKSSDTNNTYTIDLSKYPPRNVLVDGYILDFFR